MNSLGDGSFHAVDEEDATEHGGGGALPQCSEIVELPTPGKRQPQAKRRAADEAANQARSIVHALSVFSSVAHISGMGLKAVPAIAAFSTLRAVNLSGNLIGTNSRLLNRPKILLCSNELRSIFVCYLANLY